MTRAAAAALAGAWLALAAGGCWRGGAGAGATGGAQASGASAGTAACDGVAGVVLDAARAPTAGATVALATTRGREATAVTDARGAFQLPRAPLPARLVIYAPGGAFEVPLASCPGRLAVVLTPR